jgi:hypothetical protein
MLIRHGGDVLRAARAYPMSKSAMYRWLKKFEINKADYVPKPAPKPAVSPLTIPRVQAGVESGPITEPVPPERDIRRLPVSDFTGRNHGDVSPNRWPRRYY